MEINSAISLNYLDIGLMLLLALTTFNGFYRGMAMEVGGLAAFLLGVLAAGKFYQNAYDALAPYIANTAFRGILAYAGIFLLAAVATGFAVQVLRKFISIAMLGWVDRLLGIFAGFAKGALIGILILVVMNYIFPDNSLLSGSYLVPYFDAVMEQLSLWPQSNSLEDLSRSIMNRF